MKFQLTTDDLYNEATKGQRRAQGRFESLSADMITAATTGQLVDRIEWSASNLAAAEYEAKFWTRVLNILDRDFKDGDQDMLLDHLCDDLAREAMDHSNSSSAIQRGLGQARADEAGRLFRLLTAI
tara:strand:+ start:210 stop:587 length:378 start_codon:yes stop_codon:yes gene_type:complete